MALVIEDGTGKSNSTSYASVAELDAYASARGITLPATEGEKEILLVKSMDYLESQQFQGSKQTKEQALQWPRSEVYIDGWYVETTEIQVEVKKAQMIGAVILQAGGDLQPTIEPKVISETVVGAVSVRYSDSSASYDVYSDLIAAMAPLLGNVGSSTFEVSRG